MQSDSGMQISRFVSYAKQIIRILDVSEMTFLL